ncbi:MAG: flagellar hook-associated protein FlgK, partial [Planctomycetes bacterium]|nr:flagellar hook-associated protein FlgK [Planctomycetota bacterium]
MSGYEIGLAGLQVAQKAIQIIGNNIANAATEGYHRQEAVISPIPGNSLSTLATGQGAIVTDVRRLVDELLEQ